MSLFCLGVTFQFRRYSVNVQSSSRTYYRCTACWESSGSLTLHSFNEMVSLAKMRNARCFGGFAIVQGGHIVGHDPDYPPFCTGHPCQGGQLTHWTPAPLPVKEPLPSTEEPKHVKSLIKPKKEARHEVVDAFAASAPKRLRHPTSTLQESTSSGDPSPSSSSNVPSFGAAIRDPLGTAVFYRYANASKPDSGYCLSEAPSTRITSSSSSSPGSTRTTGRRVGSTHAPTVKRVRFHARLCRSCIQSLVGQQQPVPVITEEHRFILRDPDWPASKLTECANMVLVKLPLSDAPHACMQSGHAGKHQLPQ